VTRCAQPAETLRHRARRRRRSCSSSEGVRSDPSERDAFVAGRIEAMRNSRAEQGCIEYVIAADTVGSGRAVLFERWESQADLDAHLARPRQAPPSDARRHADGRVDPCLRRDGRTPAVVIRSRADQPTASSGGCAPAREDGTWDR